MAILGGFLGSTPRTPKAKILKTDVGKVQQDAIQSNIAAFPGLANLSDIYSKDQLDQLNSILPGYGDALKSGGAATQALFESGIPLLHGEVPQDVQDFTRRVAAQQALSGGYGGSEMARNLTLRDLGLTSLQGMNQGAALTGQGYNTLQAWDALARRSMLPTSSFLVTPQQAIGVDQENRLRQYNALQQSYNAQAQANPLHQTVMSLVEAYLGTIGAHGGGMGGSPSSSAPGPYGSYEGKEGGFLGIGGTPVYRGTPIFNDAVNTSYNYAGDPNILYGRPFG